jgi:hypothetical protein
MKRIVLPILLFLIAGCSTVDSPLVQATSTPITTLPVETAIISPTPLPEPTSTPMLPAPSPLSTLPPAEAEAIIFDLLQNNEGCLLPCWWGLTPGESSQKDAQSLLETMETDFSRFNFYDNVSGASWFIKSDGLLLDLIVSFIHDRVLVDVVESFRITMEVKRELSEGGFETVWENPLNERYLQAYMLPQILSVYGQPKEVFIFANEGWRYFNLVLDYSNRGFAIWYSAPLESSSDKYIGCMSKTFIRLYLWAPEFSYTWAEGVAGTGDKSEIDALNRDFRPLEEVTSTTLEEFYDTFMTTDHIGCIETPRGLWPGP